MQYFIDSPPACSELLFPVFDLSFRQFLGDLVRPTFERVVREQFAVSYLHEEDRAIALCFHRVVSCEDPAKPPPYFKDSPPEFLQKIAGTGDYLTIEWMSVHPDKLGRFSKVQYVDLILGSALRFSQESGFQGSMGFSRQDIKTDRITERFGTVKQGEVERFGIPCSIVLVKQGELKAHPVSRTQTQLDQLWQQRNCKIQITERRTA